MNAACAVGLSGQISGLVVRRAMMATLPDLRTFDALPALVGAAPICSPHSKEGVPGEDSNSDELGKRFRELEKYLTFLPPKLPAGEHVLKDAFLQMRSG